ncbi:integral membrane protein DUF92-domain-containing protein [Myxozyma melibiosi]|uniref:Integral membrane protein DUF92-domain-containing protein n=1 Tax=Myxozyma melibiosi TaxID=54550 RepID=A0ABR1F7A1_9ASCO
MGLIGIILRCTAVVGMMQRAGKRKSLTPNGLTAGMITGLIHAVHPWSIFTILLFGFFITGTAFTKVKANIKKKLTVSPTGGAGGEGPRTEVQVLANSVIASVLILLHALFKRSQCFDSDILAIGVIAQYAAVTADTWSSELGILSRSRPILITTMRPCPPGTNGGVSQTGLISAFAGGAFVGLLTALFAPFCDSWSLVSRLRLIFGIAIVGFTGSILDSLLGATLQQSVANDSGVIIEVEGGEKKRLSGKIVSGADVLSNNGVNLAMAFATTVLTMFIAYAFYGFH